MSNETDPLFLGLTRPALVAGVSFSYFALNMMICTLYFIIATDFKVIVIGVLVHLFGYTISKSEPLAVELLLTKLSKCPSVINKSFYNNSNSYDKFDE